MVFARDPRLVARRLDGAGGSGAPWSDETETSRTNPTGRRPNVHSIRRQNGFGPCQCNFSCKCLSAIVTPDFKSAIQHQALQCCLKSVVSFPMTRAPSVTPLAHRVRHGSSDDSADSSAAARNVTGIRLFTRRKVSVFSATDCATFAVPLHPRAQCPLIG